MVSGDQEVERSRRLVKVSKQDLERLREAKEALRKTIDESKRLVERRILEKFFGYNKRAREFLEKLKK